jgi:transposase
MDARTLPALGPLARAEHRGAGHRGAQRSAPPEQGFRTCLGILRLFRGLDPARAEAVSARAVAIGALTYKSLASILAHNLDRARRQPESVAVIDHPNVRGPRYFH